VTRDAELAAIVAFLDDRSPTRCPPRYVAPVALAFTRAEEGARLARLQLRTPPTLPQQLASFFSTISYRRSR